MQFATSRLFRSFELYLEKNNNKKLFKNCFGQSKVFVFFFFLQIMIPEGRVGPQWRLKFLHKEIYGEKKLFGQKSCFLRRIIFRQDSLNFVQIMIPRDFSWATMEGVSNFYIQIYREKSFNILPEKPLLVLKHPQVVLIIKLVQIVIPGVRVEQQ